TDIQEDASSVTFTFFEDMWRFDTKGALTDEKHAEFDLGFSKENSLQQMALDWPGRGEFFDKMLELLPFEKGEATPDDCDGQDVEDGDGQPYDCIRYFNLVAKKRQAPPPLAVREKD